MAHQWAIIILLIQFGNAYYISNLQMKKKEKKQSNTRMLPSIAASPFSTTSISQLLKMAFSDYYLNLIF